MADAKILPIVLWAVTVVLTYLTSQSFGLTAGVAFLAGGTAFVAYITGRGDGLSQAEQAARRDRSLKRKATRDHARTTDAMADEAERELRQLVEARPGWTVNVAAAGGGGWSVEVRRDGEVVRSWSDRRRSEAVTKARDEVRSHF